MKKVVPTSIINSVLVIVVIDIVVTLIGQPEGYWTNTSNLSESSPLGILTLKSSPYVFIIFMSSYILFWKYLLKKIDIKYSIPTLLALSFGHVVGSSSWIPHIIYKITKEWNATYDQISWYIMLLYVISLGLFIGYFIKIELYKFKKL